MPPKTESDQPEVNYTKKSRPPTNSSQAAEGAAEPLTLEGSKQPIDINHAMLLEAIEDSGITVSYSYSTDIFN